MDMEDGRAEWAPVPFSLLDWLWRGSIQGGTQTHFFLRFFLHFFILANLRCVCVFLFAFSFVFLRVHVAVSPPAPSSQRRAFCLFANLVNPFCRRSSSTTSSRSTPTCRRWTERPWRKGTCPTWRGWGFRCSSGSPVSTLVMHICGFYWLIRVPPPASNELPSSKRTNYSSTSSMQNWLGPESKLNNG